MTCGLLRAGACGRLDRQAIGLALFATLAVASLPAAAEVTLEKDDFKLTFSGRVVLEVGHTSECRRPRSLT